MNKFLLAAVLYTTSGLAQQPPRMHFISKLHKEYMLVTTPDDVPTIWDVTHGRPAASLQNGKLRIYKGYSAKKILTAMLEAAKDRADAK